MMLWGQISLLERSFFAGLLAFLIVLVLGRPLKDWLQKKQFGQVIRAQGPSSHYAKKDTPTAGGILIIFSILVSSMLFGNWESKPLWIGAFVLLTTGLVGLWDDVLKRLKKNSSGLKAKYKYFALSVIALLTAVWVFKLSPAGSLHVPVFSKEMNFGIWMIVLDYFVLTGSTNAVNLTDGLDGLVTVLVAIAASVFLADIFLLQHHFFSLSSVFYGGQLPGSSELAVLAGGTIGACLGFWWFNGYPAQWFMGDVGSLGLGGVLGYLAIALKLQLLYVLIGGVFVVEALSVILQVAYFKSTKGKRIFRMSPIHHHFELGGLPESKVTTRFWIVGLFLGLLSFWLV